MRDGWELKRKHLSQDCLEIQKKIEIKNYDTDYDLSISTGCIISTSYVSRRERGSTKKEKKRWVLNDILIKGQWMKNIKKWAATHDKEELGDWKNS